MVSAFFIGFGSYGRDNSDFLPSHGVSDEQQAVFYHAKDGIPIFAITYKGESITFDQPGWYCDQSDEDIIVGKDLRISDRMLYRLKARSEGLLEPEEIRRIRKKLKLTQEAAGLVIGGGPRAFHMYESGDRSPSRAVSSALILLDHDPKALAMLRSRPQKAAASDSHAPQL